MIRATNEKRRVHMYNTNDLPEITRSLHTPVTTGNASVSFFRLFRKRFCTSLHESDTGKRQTERQPDGYEKMSTKIAMVILLERTCFRPRFAMDGCDCRQNSRNSWLSKRSANPTAPNTLWLGDSSDGAAT